MPLSIRYVALALVLTPPLALPAHSQQEALHASPPLPSFEVATIKPREPGFIAHGALPGLVDEGYLPVKAKQLLIIAYQVPNITEEPRVLNIPAWAKANDYVIHWKVPAETFARMQHMTMVERQRQQCLMLQSLLASRFHLQVHFEKRTVPGYDLVVDKDGLKLTPAIAPTNTLRDSGQVIGALGQTDIGMDSDGTLIAGGRNLTLDSLAINISSIAGRLVVNRTGISGNFDVPLRVDAVNTVFSRFITQPRNPNAPAPPTIFEALKQLGLKLQPSNVEEEYVVIDHIEEPTEN